MKLIFLDAAQADLEQTIDYYDEQRLGLGLEFAEEVEQALVRIEHYPEAWSQLSERIRRCLLNRFPHGIIYQVRSENIIIVAIQNFRREPDSWRSRVR